LFLLRGRQLKQGRELRGRQGRRGESSNERLKSKNGRKFKEFRARAAGHAAGLPVPNGTTVRILRGKKFAAGRWAAIRHGPTVPHPAGKKNRKLGPPVRSVGPPVQPRTGPRIEFRNFPDQRPDQRGPVRSGPVRSGLGPKTAHPKDGFG